MQFDKPIALAADHGGYELKESIKAHLTEQGIAFVDFGTDSAASVDYPDYAAKGCDAVLNGSCALTILCCGTGLCSRLYLPCLRRYRYAGRQDLPLCGGNRPPPAP